MTVAAAGFDKHTAVADGRAEIATDLTGFGGTLGGYVAAIALRATSDPVGARPPRSLTTHLLAPIAPGRVDLATRVDRAGASMSSASLRIDQDGATVATALAAFGVAHPSLTHAGLAMPDVPPPEDCRPLVDRPVAEASAALLVEHRPAAPPLPLTGGDRARILVWMRLVEDRPVDAPLAAMLADAGPPGLYGKLDHFVAMPSADITLHFADLAAATASPWVLGDFRTGHAGGGYAIEDGELWTPDGRLILQARQLRRVLD